MFWGPISQVVVLKIGAQDVVSKPFTPLEKTGSCKFLPNCVSLAARVGVMVRLCLSLFTCFSVVFFSFAQWCRSHSVSGFISEGVVPSCSCRFGVSVGGGEFSIFLHRHLEPELDDLFFALKFKKFVIPILLRLFESIEKYKDTIAIHSPT